MTYEATSGRNVSTQYGRRSTGNTVGTDHTRNSTHELSVEFSGTSLNDSTFLPPFVVPKGAHFVRAFLHVHESFNLGGTTPVVRIGGTLPATNGLTLSEAQLEGGFAVIDVSSALAGTWATASATGTTAAEEVTIALGGTNPTVASGVGKASVVMEYVYKTRELGSSN